ncbi:MAG TPA: sensor histidine kinase [Terriglobia bacterium]|jgi:signal transduction histidine kinase
MEQAPTKPGKLRTGFAYSYLHQLLEAEKIQLARDLHDGLGQELTILKMGLAEISRESGRANAVKGKCRELSRLVDLLIENIRSMCVDLYPSLLEEAGLFPTLEWYFTRFETQTGLTCRWRTVQKTVIDSEKATQVFRIIQEALTNIARHAKAKSVTVDTICGSTQFTVEVRDDGKGIRKEAISGYSSMGIMNMKERARLIGGSLNILSSAGGGTLVRFEIPLSHCSATFGTAQHDEIVQRLNNGLAEQLRLLARQKAIHQEIRSLRGKQSKRRTG